MSLISVFNDHIRQDRIRDYEERIADLAAAARKKKEAWNWTAHQTAFGQLSHIRYVSFHDDYADLEKHGDPLALFTRVLGEKRGTKHLDETTECLWSNDRAINRHRPELSYPQERDGKIAPLVSVAVLRARPGGRPAVEELLRKFAEAIPKTGEQASLRTYQALIGDMGAYLIVRPLDSLSELDKQSVGRDLVVKAYGQQEGERIFQAGLEATLEMQREILAYRKDLSNPPS